MSASVPVNVSVAEPLAVPFMNVRPATRDRRSRPWSADSVTSNRPPPASTSWIRMALPCAASNTSGEPPAVCCEPGTMLTGASLTAAMSSVMLALAVWPPPEPVLPLSLTLTLSVTWPAMLAPGR